MFSRFLIIDLLHFRKVDTTYFDENQSSVFDEQHLNADLNLLRKQF